MHKTTLQKTKEFVKRELEWLCSAHDYHHIERVWKLAKKIYETEKQWDELVIEMAALLHESFDEKFYSKDELVLKKEQVAEFLRARDLSPEQFKKVYFILEHIGFGKSINREKDFVAFPEFSIVEDADRLEAIGAIAIARTFAYGGRVKRPIYNPEMPTQSYISSEAYHSSGGSSVHHFYEKLLRLRDMLTTDTAKKMAQKRHEFMELYLTQFFAEWNLEG